MAAPEKFPCIVKQGNEEYHASPGISKSGLWEIYKKTPGHWRYGKREPKPHFTLGHVAHCAVLEPAEIESRYRALPQLNKNTNAWKDLVAAAQADGYEPIDQKTMDAALFIRDAAQKCPPLRALTDGGRIEQAGYAIDEETGVIVRVKPDVYNKKLRLAGDLKSAADGSEWGFSKAIGDFGYHVQDQMYQDVWRKCGQKIDGFVFAVIESSEPWAVACYEINPPEKREGFAIYRKALAIYAEHAAAEAKDSAYEWPMYKKTVQPIGMRRYEFKLTEPPEDAPK